MSTNTYGIDALSYILDHAINGNRARSEIRDKTIRQQIHEMEQASRPLTEEEEIEAAKKWLREKEIAKLNFELAQIQKEKLEG